MSAGRIPPNGPAMITPFPAATVMLFGQSSAPTGWTKKTDWTDLSMIVYTTGDIGSGGADDPKSWETAISVDAHSITQPTFTSPGHEHGMMSHTHTLGAGASILKGDDYAAISGGPSSADTATYEGAACTRNVDVALSAHSVNQDTFAPKYQSVIACTKD